MDVGARVRDKNTNSVGIIERQNLSSFLVSFEGGKKLWRKSHELEPESARSSMTPRPGSSTNLRGSGGYQQQYQQYLQQQSQQPQQPQSKQRGALGSGSGSTSPVLGRAALGGAASSSPHSPSPPSSSPSAAPRPGLGAPAGPPPGAARPSLGAGSGGGSAPVPAAKNGTNNNSGPVRQAFDSTDNRHAPHTPPPISNTANNNSNNASNTNSGSGSGSSSSSNFSSNNGNNGAKAEAPVASPPPPAASPPAPAPVAVAKPAVVPEKSSSQTLSESMQPLANAPQDEEMWNIAFAELEFGDVIGSGKFGEVYIGTYLGTPVAIKKILDTDEETRKSIEREITMLKGVKHPNIVQFLGLCLHKGDIFLVTEYMDRGDLFDVLFFGDTDLSWKLKLKISLDIAMPCYYLQAKSILHRDLKSQNILLCSENYKAKLCDLGLARALDTASRRLTFVGTDRWMAPEICLGIDYDYKVDVFSFGVVLMEIITQAVPDERRAQDRFAFNEGAFRAKVPKSCPPGFAQLAIDCTKLDPRTRPTFKSVLERVKRLYEEQDDE